MKSWLEDRGLWPIRDLETWGILLAILAAALLVILGLVITAHFYHELRTADDINIAQGGGYAAQNSNQKGD